MMKCFTFMATCVLGIFLCMPEGLARRTYFTPDQKAQLEKAQLVFVKVLALTERGRGDPAPMLEIVTIRMKEVGYTVVTQRKDPYDVEFRVKCEERKKWAGTTRSGGDADLADSPARLWKGPACLFEYRLQGKDLGWYKEIRTDFEQASVAAKTANVKNAGTYALSQLKIKLEEYDFPVVVSAEWGQDDRLLKLLKDPSTSQRRKLTILTVMKKLKSHQALPYLKEIIEDKEFAEEGIAALSATGSDAIPYLVELFQTSQDSKIQAAAAKGLGTIGAGTGNPAITPPLLEYLKKSLKHMNTPEDIDYPVLTEVVWGLGKQRNEESIAPIRELEVKVWLIYDTSADMKDLREATNWTVKQIDLDGQIQ